MSRRQKEPLRALRAEEQAWLSRLTRSTGEPANHVIRATQLLAVSAGQSYTQAARRTGRRSGDAVAQLVRRFNREGLPALERRRGGGAKRRYSVADRAEIVATARRRPVPMARYGRHYGSWPDSIRATAPPGCTGCCATAAGESIINA